MEKELEMMTYINEKEDITQRELAEVIGVSLGNINIMLKKMINSGFVHIEKFNSKEVKYMLTPLGINEKSQKTYDYVTESCNTMINVLKRLKICLNNQYQSMENIYFYGEENEIYPMMVYFCDEIEKTRNCKLIKDLQKVNKPSRSLIIVWNREYEEDLDKKGFKTLNILELM